MLTQLQTMLLLIMQLLETWWIPIILIQMRIPVWRLLLMFSMVKITTHGCVLCSLLWRPRKSSNLWMVLWLVLLLMIPISLYGIIVIPWWFHGFIILLIHKSCKPSCGWRMHRISRILSGNVIIKEMYFESVTYKKKFICLNKVMLISLLTLQNWKI